MPITVKVSKRGKDGRPIYYGVYENGKLAMQVVRTKAEADRMAKTLREWRKLNRKRR